jgi:signal transduction histidine kinase
MTYIRWFGVLFGTGSLAIGTYPDRLTENLAWTLVAILAAGSFAIWGASARMTTEADHRRLGFVGFAFDAAVVMGFVWLFTSQTPYVSWALLFILPLEGALRYQLTGAMASTGLICIFFLGESFNRAALLGEPFDTSTYVFVVSLSAIIAGVTGSMANQWRAQSRAFEEQSLRLAEVDELKDRFLAITSHEIRGPLTAIIAGVDTVRKRADRMTPEQSDRLLEMVSLQGMQLARLVDDLQITSQVQAGQLALLTQWSEIEPPIRQALEAAASRRRHHQLELFLEPMEAEIDASRVGQIVRNLVENAYKYTHERTRVSVTAKVVDGGLRIEVADEGKGIPADRRSQLFDAFSRIEETAAGQEGVGLGLYVVSQLVTAMKGDIDLASSERGTTFGIYIPCATKRIHTQSHLGLVTQDDGIAEA